MIRECACGVCVVSQLAEVMVWIMMLLFFAIWPRGCSLCSVVSETHKGTVWLSDDWCVGVCVCVYTCVIALRFFLSSIWSGYLLHNDTVSLFYFLPFVVFPPPFQPFRLLVLRTPTQPNNLDHKASRYFKFTCCAETVECEHSLLSQLTVLYFSKHCKLSDGEIKVATWQFHFCGKQISPNI